MTSRNEEVGFDLDECLPVPVLQKEAGSRFLRQMAGQKADTQDEIRSGEDLSETVDGHPLALLLMGRMIRNKRRRVSQYYREYDPTNFSTRASESRGGHFYPHNLNTIFRKSFETIGPEASLILGVACMIAPDAIPETLFQRGDRAGLPKPLAFCHSLGEVGG